MRSKISMTLAVQNDCGNWRQIGMWSLILGSSLPLPLSGCPQYGETSPAVKRYKVSRCNLRRVVDVKFKHEE